MADHRERIRHLPSLEKVLSAEEAASLVEDGMTIATSGNPLMGCPRAFFQALAQRVREKGGIKIDLLCAGPLAAEVEDLLVEAGGLRSRIGAVGGPKLREAVNRGEVRFVEGKGGQLPLQVKRGWYGPVHLAVIEAVGLTKEGFIIPSTALYDSPEWVEAAREVIVEINVRRPLGLEGLHDVYQRGGEAIPLTVDDPLKRIGLPYIPLDSRKIKAVVFSDLPEGPSREGGPDPLAEPISRHLGEFFQGEMAAGRLDRGLPPLELGVGDLAGNVMRALGSAGLGDFRFHLPSVTDPVFELLEAGRVRWVSAMALRLTPEVWGRFASGLERFKRQMVLRPVSVCNSPELIQRFGVVAINGCLEMDLQGQVNSSHVFGARILTGIAGSYDYSRNSLYSIFVAPSTTKEGKISTVVPLVSHVDHTEHEVDILVTEQGLADLRGLDPQARAREIIAKCAHPAFREALRKYLDGAGKGHIPADLEGGFSFHSRLRRAGTMREG